MHKLFSLHNFACAQMQLLCHAIGDNMGMAWVGGWGIAVIAVIETPKARISVIPTSMQGYLGFNKHAPVDPTGFFPPPRCIVAGTLTGGRNWLEHYPPGYGLAATRYTGINRDQLCLSVTMQVVEVHS